MSGVELVPSAVILLSSGKEALVDHGDLDIVAPYRWASIESGSGLFYARGWVGPRRQLMHSLLTGWDRVDHVNGNGLDNRRANLRPASRSENMANRRKGTVGSSRFKGVCLQRSNGRWKAQIGVNRERIYLGLFDSEEDAARAYDERARQVFGPFAALNFPREGENPCRR